MGKSGLVAQCYHRRRPATVVYTELGCHARCSSCGALGPGCPDPKAARLELLSAGRAHLARRR